MTKCKCNKQGRENGHEYLVIHTWETKGRPLMSHMCDCDCEVGKKECEEIEKLGF